VFTYYFKDQDCDPRDDGCEISFPTCNANQLGWTYVPDLQPKCCRTLVKSEQDNRILMWDDTCAGNSYSSRLLPNCF